MSQIKVLDEKTANLIAAGEVVDRPASVAKELCENALDAGATALTIEVKAGGTRFLRVTDNGKGMSRADALLCVTRHATSKISSPEDLVSIASLGFRGEALAAICAVCRLTILTKRPQDDFGTSLNYEGGSLLREEDAGCPDGTTVLVSDLFFNQPARQKFLKRDATEQAAVLQYIERLAIAFPAVSFKYISEGSTRFQTIGDGDRLGAIRAIFGKEFADGLFPVSAASENLRVDGFVSRPEHARKNRSLQCFYVNARYVKSKTMLFATDDAFRSYLKSDRHPAAFLFLQTALSDVDVNVHPAKLEVRFSDERAVYRAVYGAVRSGIEKLKNPLSKDFFEPESIPKLPKAEQMRFSSLTPRKESAPKLAVFSAPSAAPGPKHYPYRPPETPAMTYVKAAKLFEAERAADAPPAERDNPLADQDGRYLGEVFHAFLLYEAADVLYCIDKHAAHERILYEALKRREAAKGQQLLLSPVIVAADALESAALTDALAEIKNAGFDLESFGDNTFALRAVPMEFAGMGEGALCEVILAIADELLRGGKAAEKRDALWDKVLYSAACKAAMKAGRIDDEKDCLWVIDSLKEMENIFVCPHGRPICARFDRHAFEKLFFRT